MTRHPNQPTTRTIDAVHFESRRQLGSICWNATCRHLKRLAFAVLMLSCCGSFNTTIAQDAIQFGQTELKTRLSVGYAVRLIDMNEDDRLDICIVDSKRILWLENPNWNEHVLIETPERTDNVCFAPADIDQDGRLDFAVGGDWTVNTKEGGLIEWLTRSQPDIQSDTDETSGNNPSWQLFPIGAEPTVHRMEFADVDGDEREELIVLPLMGRNSTRPDFAEAGVRILMFDVPGDPQSDAWEPQVISDELHVTHNLLPCDFNGDAFEDLLVVSFEGVFIFERNQQGEWTKSRIGEGDQESSPSRGASEIGRGRISEDETFLATIEPWHGNKVVVYRQPETERPEAGQPWLWKRVVIDDQLQWGHAVACANLDDDPEDELVIGVRDSIDDSNPRGLRIYDLDRETGKWNRHLIDPSGVAIEALDVGDLNGDGRAEVVAVGRQTHNIKIYWNETAKE